MHKPIKNIQEFNKKMAEANKKLVDKLQTQNKKMKKALEFYGDPDFWGRKVNENENDEQHLIPIDMDIDMMKCGWRARKALEEIEWK